MPYRNGDESTPPTIGELDKRLDRLERGLGITAGNASSSSDAVDRVVDHLFRLLERIRRLEVHAGLTSPEGTDALAPEDVVADDPPPDDVK